MKCGLHSALHPRHCVCPAKSNGTGRSTMVYPAGQRGHVTQADIKSTFYWQQAIVRPSKFCKVAAAAGRRPGAGRQLPSAHVAAGVRLDRKWQITKCCCEAPGCGPPRLSSRRRQLREGDASSVRHREAQRCLRSHCGHARRQFNMQSLRLERRGIANPFVHCESRQFCPAWQLGPRRLASKRGPGQN